MSKKEAGSSTKNGKSPSVYASSEKKYMDRWQNWKDKLILPLLKLMKSLGITANMISYSSLLWGVLFLVFIFYDIRVSLVFLIISVFSDGLDGSMARFTKKTDSKGFYADVFSDTVVIILTSLGFYIAGLITSTTGLAYVFAYILLLIMTICRHCLKDPFKFLIRPRLFVYLLFFVYVVSGFNILNEAMMFFAVVMLIEISFGLGKLKRAIEC